MNGNLRNKILFFCLLLVQFGKANMSSPYWNGTKIGSAFSSKDINILAELIYVQIDSNYRTAKFIVEYNIKSDVLGMQIPLLFYAKDYKDSFLVWVDGKKTNLQNIPEKYVQIENSPFDAFSNYFAESVGYSKTASIYWHKNIGDICNLSDLKYFETDLSKGVHKIRVEYIANVWVNLRNWAKEYSFRYSLTPAKFWKSFGELKIVVTKAGVTQNFTTNIGEPIEKTIGTKNTWLFHKLPDEFIFIEYKPQINLFAKLLIALEPFGLSIILSIILIAFHIHNIKKFRKNNTTNKYSKVVILGSLFVPLIVLLSYVFSFTIIDMIIGEEASKYHGYFFLTIFLYPILLLVYWIIIWLVDKYYKARLLKQKQGYGRCAPDGQ